MDFRTRHDRTVYLKACETARRIIADHSLIDDAMQYLASDDNMPLVYREMWADVLRGSAEDIADALLADSPRGQLLRETQPVFGRGFTAQDVRVLLETLDSHPPQDLG